MGRGSSVSSRRCSPLSDDRVQGMIEGRCRRAPPSGVVEGVSEGGVGIMEAEMVLGSHGTCPISRNSLGGVADSKLEPWRPHCPPLLYLHLARAASC